MDSAAQQAPEYLPLKGGDPGLDPGSTSPFSVSGDCGSSRHGTPPPGKFPLNSPVSPSFQRCPRRGRRRRGAGSPPTPGNSLSKGTSIQKGGGGKGGGRLARGR